MIKYFAVGLLLSGVAQARFLSASDGGGPSRPISSAVVDLTPTESCKRHFAHMPHLRHKNTGRIPNRNYLKRISWESISTKYVDITYTPLEPFTRSCK